LLAPGWQGDQGKEQTKEERRFLHSFDKSLVFEMQHYSAFKIVFFLVLVSCTPSKEVRLQQFLLKGNGALKEQNTVEATRYFTEALRLDPCFVEALNNLGTMAFQSNNWEEALGYYDKAIECNANYLPAYFNRVNTYYELKQYYNARQDIQRIKKSKPDTAVVHFAEGLVATKTRDYEAALQAFDKAISLDSTNAEFLVNRGTVNYYRHRYEEAEADLKRAEYINPAEANIYNTRAMIAVQRGDHAVAYAEIEKALRIAPDQPYFVNNRGFILLMQSKLPEGLTEIDRSILMDPDNGWAYRNKGIYYLLNGDYGRAVKLLRQAAEMDNFIERVHFYLGMAYLKNGQQREACEQFELSEKAGDKMVTSALLKPCQ
jgi:tetratricopeptide (TPR) repeat protein